MITVSESTTRGLWLGLLGLVVLYFFALIFTVMPMEQSIRDRVESALQEHGYQRVVAQVRGRDVILQGKVASDAAIQRSLAIARNIEGVRVANPRLSVEPIRLPHLRIRISNGEIPVIEGELPNALHMDRLLDQLAAGGIVEQELQVKLVSEIAEPQWLDRLTELLKICQPLNALRLEIGARKVSVAGTTDNPGIYLTLLEALKKFSASAGLKLVNRIATVEV